MASALCRKLSPVFHFRNVLNTNATSTITVTRSYWNKDFQPGPYPRTPEERAAAAKKYGLLPEDYEPYPDDGHGYGDYPKLPAVSAESRDPYYAWDYPEYKRNFNEPLHKDFDMLGEDRYNANARPRISYHMQFLAFMGVVLTCFGLFLLGEKYKVHKPVMPKQMPYTGTTHYTFEPAD